MRGFQVQSTTSSGGMRRSKPSSSSRSSFQVPDTQQDPRRGLQFLFGSSCFAFSGLRTVQPTTGAPDVPYRCSEPRPASMFPSRRQAPFDVQRLNCAGVQGCAPASRRSVLGAQPEGSRLGNRASGEAESRNCRQRASRRSASARSLSLHRSTRSSAKKSLRQGARRACIKEQGQTSLPSTRTSAGEPESSSQHRGRLQLSPREFSIRVDVKEEPDEKVYRCERETPGRSAKTSKESSPAKRCNKDIAKFQPYDRTRATPPPVSRSSIIALPAVVGGMMVCPGLLCVHASTVSMSSCHSCP